ncbi:hypothetical protein Q9L58_003084 [Maublancomyces gigas]|uniref:Uncharacterized protein n=1 Tax=Discina gigas TaxID=1032678 RepID=A0ABR3GPK2_9PEZI
MEHEKSPLKGPDDPDSEIFEKLPPRRLFQDNLALLMRSELPSNSQSPNPTLKQSTLSAINSSTPAPAPTEADMELPPKAPPAKCSSAAFTGAAVTASPRINAIREAANTTPTSPRSTSSPSVRLSRKKEKACGPFAAMEQNNGANDGDGGLDMTGGTDFGT